MSETSATAVESLIENGVLQINDGYRAKNSELSDHGIPFARAGNIQDGFQFADADLFPDEDLAKVGFKISQPGDVVFTSKGTVGRFAFVREDTPRFVYSPQLCFWRSLDSQRLLPRWLFYWMNGREFYEQYYGVATQTDMAAYVSLRDQRQMHMTIPPHSEQKRIAHILGTLDDKIEMNRRMNRTLEAIARSIFKSWFVDFDPVHSKAQDRDPFGMNSKTADLFPDSFEDSPLGMIPKGWEAKPIADLADFVNGRNFTKDASGIGRVVIRIAELNRGIGNSTVWNDVSASAENTAFPKDILFAWSGSLGVYRWHQDEALINQHIFKVIPKDIPSWFVYYALLEALPQFRAIASGKATTMGHIKRSHLREVWAAVPPVELIQQAAPLMSRVWDAIHSRQREANLLTEVRNAILPQLMTGELAFGSAGNSEEAGAL